MTVLTDHDSAATIGTANACPILQELSSLFLSYLLLFLLFLSFSLSVFLSSFFLLLFFHQEVQHMCLLYMPQIVLQSILTGESSSVEKHMEATQSRKAVYQDKTCLLFAVRLGLLVSRSLGLLSFRAVPSQTLLGAANQGKLLLKVGFAVAC